MFATSFGGDAVLELEDGQRLARLGVAADDVGVRHFLQRLLDLVGHLLGHLLRAGAGPEGLHDHRAEGERRVLVLAELEVRREAEHQQHDHQVARQRRMLERPARDVEDAIDGVDRLACDGARRAGGSLNARSSTPPRAPPSAPRLGVQRAPSARASAHARRRSRRPVAGAQAAGARRTVVAFGAGHLHRLRLAPSSSPCRRTHTACLPWCFAHAPSAAA